MPNAHYYHSIEVFKPDLAEAIYRHLGKAMKVTFARSDRSLTRTESLLSEQLVDRARDELDNQDILENRTVLFGPFKQQLRLPGDPQVQAKSLVQQGYSLLVIADALGYSYQTLRRWGLEARRQIYMPNGTPAELLELGKAGKARVQELRPDEDRSPKSKHYLLVGAALAWLKQVV